MCDLSGLRDSGLELDEGAGWESTGNLIMLKTKETSVKRPHEVIQ